MTRTKITNCFFIIICSFLMCIIPGGDCRIANHPHYNSNSKCAVLTIEGPEESDSLNFTLSSFPRSASLTEWQKLNQNSTINSIHVTNGCLLRLCFVRRRSLERPHVFQYCENLTGPWTTEKITTNISKWNREVGLTTGLDCSCELEKSCKPATCNLPPPTFSTNDKRECAKLFVEKNCSLCNFPEVLLRVDTPFDKHINDSLTVFSSMVVRENCTVKARATGRDGHPLDNIEYKASDQYNWIYNTTYNHSLFYCECTDGYDYYEPTTDKSSHPTGNISAVMIGLIVICSTLFLAVIGLMGMRKWEQKKRLRELHHVINHTDHRVIPRDEIDMHDFKKILGSGAFGKVYLGSLIGNGEKVAVKQIYFSSQYIGSLTREIELLSEIGSHPNVVKMIGVCVAQLESEILLVMEYCEHRSLDKFLKQNRFNIIRQLPPAPGSSYVTYSEETGSSSQSQGSSDLEVHDQLARRGYIQETAIDFNLLLNIAVDIASGMEHLHRLRIVHIDLAARNILLDKNFNAKVGDLGLSKKLEEESTYYYKPPAKHPLPLLTLAPEVLSTFKFNPKSDIWAFGVCLWELFTLGDTPYKEFNRLMIKTEIENGYRLRKPAYCGDEMYAIMQQCWNVDPSVRPDFSELKLPLGAHQSVRL